MTNSKSKPVNKKRQTLPWIGLAVVLLLRPGVRFIFGDNNKANFIYLACMIIALLATLLYLIIKKEERRWYKYGLISVIGGITIIAVYTLMHDF